MPQGEECLLWKADIWQTQTWDESPLCTVHILLPTEKQLHYDGFLPSLVS